MCTVSQVHLATHTLLFEPCTVQRKMSSFHSKVMSLEFHHCSTCLKSCPDLIMKAASSTECKRCSQQQQLPESGDVSELTSLQLEESTTGDQSHVPSQEDLYGATFQAPFCLMLSNNRQSKRQFASLLRNGKLDPPTPSCGPLLGEHALINEFTTQ